LQFLLRFVTAENDAVPNAARKYTAAVSPKPKRKKQLTETMLNYRPERLLTQLPTHKSKSAPAPPTGEPFASAHMLFLPPSSEISKPLNKDLNAT